VVTYSTIADLSRDPVSLAMQLAGSFPGLALDAVRIARAPGRVNLIGEHTDYNDGLVLPVAIDLGVSIAFVPTADRRVEVVLAATGERDGFDLDSIGPPRGASIDYLTGVAWVFAVEGVATTGLRGLVAADLPVGAGLGSSAALELAASLALTAGGASSIDPMNLARLAQRAENEYVGVRCGLMDQFAAVFGQAGNALLLDCRSLEHRSVGLPDDEIAIVVCHTGSSRRLETSAYNERRAECDRALAGLTALDPSIRSLRDATPELLEAARDRLDEVAFRRARHVVTEIARVRAVVDALDTLDLDTIGRMFAASHASLRDDFEVGAPELDVLVEIARVTPGVIASRQTGAGFGGCTVSLVRPAAVTGFRERIMAEYPARTGREPTTWEVAPSDGAALLD
jgi:galactokinase